MTQTTTPTIDLKSLKSQAKDLASQRKAVSEALKAGKTNLKAQEAQEAQALMADIKSLGDTQVIVGEGDEAVTLTLEEALISGKPSTIMVADKTTGEKKERAHTIRMDAGRIASLRKLVTRFRKIAQNEEIRPKVLPKDETPAA